MTYKIASMLYVIDIDWSEPGFPWLVGPFESREEAEAWAANNIRNGEFNIAPLGMPL